MKRFSRKTKLYLGIIACITAIVVISIILFFNSKNNSILFRSSCENYAWGASRYGYRIYSNGDIKEYDDYDKNRKLKSAKISNEELVQLKELASTVEDKYEKDTTMVLNDAGICMEEIYNDKLSKWVVLSQYGDSMGKNPTKTSEKILELTEQIYDKYLKEN